MSIDEHYRLCAIKPDTTTGCGIVRGVTPSLSPAINKNINIDINIDVNVLSFNNAIISIVK